MLNKQDITENYHKENCLIYCASACMMYKDAHATAHTWTLRSTLWNQISLSRFIWFPEIEL